MAARPDLVGEVVTELAREHRLTLAHDTHYDARNWVLSWWHGKTLHRFDVQPMPEGHAVVTHYRDKFPLLPRVLRWANRYIPMFPYFAKIEWQSVGEIESGTTRGRFKEQLDALLRKAV